MLLSSQIDLTDLAVFAKNSCVFFLWRDGSPLKLLVANEIWVLDDCLVKQLVSRRGSLYTKQKPTKSRQTV